MKIVVDDDVQRFLEDQMRAGAFNAPGELVNSLVRAVQKQQEQTFEISPELEAWLLEAAEKPTSPLTHEDFVSVRERVQARLSASHS